LEYTGQTCAIPDRCEQEGSWGESWLLEVAESKGWKNEYLNEKRKLVFYSSHILNY
jgi:hypothetical protein